MDPWYSIFDMNGSTRHKYTVGVSLTLTLNDKSQCYLFIPATHIRYTLNS